MLVAARRNSSDSASRTKARPPSWVRVRRPVVRTGAVRLARSGRRRVPENLVMAMLLWWVVDGDGPVREQGGRAVPSRTAGARMHPSPRKEARPSQLTGDGVGLGTRR